MHRPLPYIPSIVVTTNRAILHRGVFTLIVPTFVVLCDNAARRPFHRLVIVDMEKSWTDTYVYEAVLSARGITIVSA